MYLLTLNRCAGYNFVRYMKHRFSVAVKEFAVPGENKVILELCPEELVLFRQILIQRPDQFENAEGILQAIGQS